MGMDAWTAEARDEYLASKALLSGGEVTADLEVQDEADPDE